MALNNWDLYVLNIVLVLGYRNKEDILPALRGLMLRNKCKK